MGLRHAVALLALVAPLAGAGAAQAAEPRCAAAAVSGTVLGQPLPLPAAGSAGDACASDDATGLTSAALPLPLTAEALTARTVRQGTGAMATGAVAGLRLRTLPALPVKLPIDELLAGVPTVPISVPLVGTVGIDLKPAVRALLGSGDLPALDLLTVDALSATGFAGCQDGAGKAFAAPQVGTVRVLGTEVPVGAGAIELTRNLLDTTSIDLGALDLTKLELPAPLSLGVVAPLLQPVLDALPPLELPAQLVRVKVSAGGQELLPGGLVRQRALRVEASLLGTSLADLTLGEAIVGAEGLACAAPPVAGPTAADLALGCTSRDVTLVDVVPIGRRVALYGAADRRFAGRPVAIRLRGTGEVVARPTVRPDGSFSATAPLPSRRLRAGDGARYQATVDGERSLDLKLDRRMRVLDVRAAGGTVTIRGEVLGPLARRAADRRIVVERRVTCTRTEVVGRVTPKRDGSFVARVPAPAGATAAVFRLRTAVPQNARSKKLFPTFTLPRAVDLR